jgi:hypothetical protein
MKEGMVVGTIRLLSAAVALSVLISSGVATQGPPAEGGAPPREGIQYDLAGGWIPIVHEDANNRAVGGEYEILAGLPLNDAARSRWEAFNENQVSLPEFQCRRYLSTYSMRTAHANLWIRSEYAPDSQRIAAYQINFQPAGNLLGGTRTIYLDGRPHPSAVSPHTFGGFSTGKWDGNMLNVEVTHLKSYYTQRPGVPASDERTVTEHWVKHGDLLTMTMSVNDPAFFTEPLVWSVTWARNDGPQPLMDDPFCHASPEVGAEEAHKVPFFLPGTNPAVAIVMKNYGVPEDVVRGTAGAAMMYPEYRKQMKQSASSLEKCQRRCDN